MGNFVLPCMAYMECIYTVGYIFCTPESTQKILWTRIERNSRKVKKTAADSKAKGKKPGSTWGCLIIAIMERLLVFYLD